MRYQWIHDCLVQMSIYLLKNVITIQSLKDILTEILFLTPPHMEKKKKNLSRLYRLIFLL